MSRLRKALKIHSIQTSMMASFMVLISIIVLFVSMISYYYTIRDIEDMSINYTLRLLQEINFSIDSYISNMKSMGQVVVENKDVRDLMTFYRQHRGKTLSPEENKRMEGLLSGVSTHLNTLSNTRNDVTNIAVISTTGGVVLSDPNKKVNRFSDYRLSDWYLKPLSDKNDIIVSPSHVQNLVANEYKWVISLSKAILDQQTGEVTGVMVIDLNYSAIESICENAQLGKSGYIYLIDNDRNLIYHPQQQLVYSGIKTELIDEILKMGSSQTYLTDTGSSKIYIKNYSTLTDWSAVGVVNTNEMIKNRASIIHFYISLAGIAIVFACLIAMIISEAITKPIRMLENTMHKVEDGDFGIQSEIHLNNEIGQLSRTFNVMIFKIKRLMAAAVSNEEEKRKNEIKALQAQINPHFLYNTLDTIIWMSAGGKNEEVVEVASALAGLFRTSISEGDNLVPLSVELENIRSYLTIQKMRYKDKLSYRVEVPDVLQDAKTPKLILQPIVENAIYHGIKMSPTGGEIRISAVAENGILTVTVEDTGVGMSPEQIAHVFTADHHDHAGMGIGVINVNNRIRLCFGEQYGLVYHSREGQGTRVDIRLPIIKEGEENHGQTS